MDSLSFLVSKGLLTPTQYPIKPPTPIKVVNNGVIFQQQCHNGLRYDIAISWLQKAIRRGLTDQALYCAYHIAMLGKIFRSHLLNRLIVILSEDVGPSEPMLAVVIADLYFSAKEQEKNGHLDDMYNTIIDMIYRLSLSRKSRITDWAIHSCDHIEIEDHFDSFETMTAWGVNLTNSREKGDVRLTYVDKKETVYMNKSLLVYNVWDTVLTLTTGNDVYRDVVALLKLYMLRGPQYGLLHLVHAISLCFMSNPVDVPVFKAPPVKWSDIKEYDFAVMNDAVDMHTYYGRKYLGRSNMEFMLHGSKLENWTPFPEEKKMIKAMIDEIRTPEIEECNPRVYQETLINNAVAHLDINRTGWLLMACGTGKTKTSYWTMKKIRENANNEGIFVVVTPFLEIMRQFHSCWAAMNRMHKIKSITGIVASCKDTFDKDDYSNYEYLDSKSDINNFMKYPHKTKFLFTTYSSVHKLRMSGIKPTLTVYDEAHHANINKLFDVGSELFLTATPHKSYYKFGDIIGKYTLRNAIDDGYLTKYEINVLSDEDEVECLAYMLEKCNKMIVYCRLNALARSFYENWLERGGNTESSFYVDGKTAKKERERILKGFRTKEKAVIFNCAILGEGVDFTDCDGIFIHSGYISPTRVVQAMGRPLRLSPGKDISYIGIMDDGKVDKRLNAMSVYDPKVYDHIEYVYNDDDDDSS